MGDGARANSRRDAEVAQASAAAARLEGEVARANAERGQAVAEAKLLSAKLQGAVAEAGEARRAQEAALAARDAAQRKLASQPPPQPPPPQPSSPSQPAPSQPSQQMAAALAEKASAVERLMSERAALRFQLESEGKRRAALERQMAQLSTGGVGGVRIDMPHEPLLGGGAGGGSARSGGGREGGAPPQPRTLTKLLTTQVRRPRPVLLHAASAADDVAEAIDRAALAAGRHLRRQRPLRLGGIGYLMLLHVWLLVLLVHMVPSIEPHQPVFRRHRHDVDRTAEHHAVAPHAALGPVHPAASPAVSPHTSGRESRL